MLQEAHDVLHLSPGSCCLTNKNNSKMAKIFKSQLVLIYTSSNEMSEQLYDKIQEFKIASRGYRIFENFRGAFFFMVI